MERGASYRSMHKRSSILQVGWSINWFYHTQSLSLSFSITFPYSLLSGPSILAISSPLTFIPWLVSLLYHNKGHHGQSRSRRVPWKVIQETTLGWMRAQGDLRTNQRAIDAWKQRCSYWCTCHSSGRYSWVSYLSLFDLNASLMCRFLGNTTTWLRYFVLVAIVQIQTIYSLVCNC